MVGPAHPIPPRGSGHPDCLGNWLLQGGSGLAPREEANWALSLVGNFSRLEDKEWEFGVGNSLAKVRALWEIGCKGVDASREGELLFERGRLREERLRMKIRASIQVVSREGGGAQPSLWSGFTGSKRVRKKMQNQRGTV